MILGINTIGSAHSHLSSETANTSGLLFLCRFSCWSSASRIPAPTPSRVLQEHGALTKSKQQCKNKTMQDFSLTFEKFSLLKVACF